MKDKITRRRFIRTASAAAAGFTIVKPKSVFGTPANSAVQVGVIGCGGRGTADAISFVNNAGARIVAIADLFENRLMSAKNRFNQIAREKDYPEIKDSHLFRGSKEYLKILELKDVDAVLIASPAFLHPMHLEATVEAGKHVYCEKPVAVDVHGCRKVMNAGKKADKNLSLAVGFQIRHATPFVEMVKRIHNGDIGDIVTAELYYFAGAIGLPSYPDASPIERRLRQWHFDRALSGDIIVEQGIHIIDVCNWVLKSHPVRARGSGGRKGKYDIGDAWSHFIVNYDYPNGIDVSFMHTQFNPGYGDVCERFFGTKGISESHYNGGVFIKGENEWDSGVARGTAQEISAKDWATGTFKSALDDSDPNKQKAFIDSIKNGRYVNESIPGAEAALSAILGRTAAYKGEEVTWNEILASDEKWDPMIDLTQFE